MLQRAASNAYSWWWASRIRTSQSKWLDGNLEEMDDRVKIILKLLGEEADSFAKRAEMYYKRRPEVISNVEEAYRAYRALAERYDHVSGELHKANHTIATAFPEQVQYAMLEDDDEDDSEHVPKAITPIDPTKIRKSTVEGLLQKRKKEKERGSKRPKSNQPKLPKEKAQAEINRLQKAILVLQTEKEFIKSSYESGISKYWELEKQMAEMQESVILIQEESGESGTLIEDDDARALMTATALKSCEEAILKLQQTHKESIELVRVESERIRVAIERLRSIKGEGDVTLGNEESQSQPLTDLVNDPVEVNQQVQHMQLEVIMEKVKKHFELNPETSVEEIAEKIDEVVGKVIELELTVSSQTAQIGRLSEENVSLEKNLEELEKGKSGLIKNSDELNKRLKEVEEELKRVKESEKMVKDEEKVFNAEFSDVVTSLNDISRKFEPGYKEDEFKYLVGYENIDVVNEAGEKEDGNNEIVLTGGAVEKVKEERDINSDNLEKFEPGVDVRENAEDKNLINSENIPVVINEAEMSGEKNLLIKQNLEELSKEDEHKKLVNSENISAINEVDMSGENSEVVMTSGPIEELKKDENNLNSDISNKENVDEYKNLVNAENTNEKGLLKEEDEKSEVVLTSGPIEQVKEEEREIISDDVSEKFEPVVDVRENAELSRESNVEALINSESNINQINDNEAQMSGEKDLIKDQSSELIPIVSFSEKEKEKEKGKGKGKRESDVKNDEKESNEDLEKIPEEIKEINEEKEAKEIEKNKKQKWSILNEIMETDSPKFEKNKKTYKRGISLQQGEREYASLSERLPNFRGEERESVMSWQELLLDGLEGRDSILLAEYTSILRNYKETKRRLNELEERNQDQFNETSRVVRELRKDNALKDDEIRVLKQLVSSLKMNNSEGKNVISEGVVNEEESLEREKEVQVEEKLKGEIDSILDENFKFMLRFSASLNRIQDFESKFKHLQSEMKIETEKEDGISNLEATSSENETKIQKPETTEKKLKDLKTEIEVWVEQISMLKQELKTRVSSLNTTQDEISQAVRASSATDGSRFSVYQGEVLSMQQEADKAEEELKAGLNIVTGIHLKIESNLGKIRESFEMPKMESEVRWNSFEKYPSKNRVPLRNFLFGPKPKKKSKFFALLNPIIQKHLRDIKAKGKHLVKS